MTSSVFLVNSGNYVLIRWPSVCQTHCLSCLQNTVVVWLKQTSVCVICIYQDWRSSLNRIHMHMSIYLFVDTGCVSTQSGTTNGPIHFSTETVICTDFPRRGPSGGYTRKHSKEVYSGQTERPVWYWSKGRRERRKLEQCRFKRQNFCSVLLRYLYNTKKTGEYSTMWGSSSDHDHWVVFHWT